MFFLFALCDNLGASSAFAGCSDIVACCHCSGTCAVARQFGTSRTAGIWRRRCQASNLLRCHAFCALAVQRHLRCVLPLCRSPWCLVLRRWRGTCLRVFVFCLLRRLPVALGYIHVLRGCSTAFDCSTSAQVNSCNCSFGSPRSSCLLELIFCELLPCRWREFFLTLTATAGIGRRVCQQQPVPAFAATGPSCRRFASRVQRTCLVIL